MNLTKIGPLVFGFVFLVGVCGCSHSQKKKREVQRISSLQKRTTMLSQKIDLSGLPKVSLSSDAERATSDWANYLNLKSEIDNLEHSTLQNLIGNTNNLVTIVLDLQDSIPKKFQTTPIQSRLTVLNTKTHILKQRTKPHHVDPRELQQAGRAIYQAFFHLNIQINEVFLQQLPDFEIDMDRKQDSIKTAHQQEKKLRNS